MWLPPTVGPASGLDVRQYTVVFPELDAAPGALEACALQAAELLQREGFVIVLNALSPEKVAELLASCREVEAEILEMDPQRIGCRDFGRYSFATAMKAGAMLHFPAWGQLLDCDAALWVLDAAFPDGWHFFNGSGDFVRGGTPNFQGLHSDIAVSRVPLEMRKYWPPPTISVNFTIQQIDSADFGPLRVIPRRKLVNANPEDKPPLFLDEEEGLQQCGLFPLPPGAAILRDQRLWHSGTPNVTAETRFLPSIEVCSKAFAECECMWFWQSLCPDVYASLSERCQAHCSKILAQSDVEIPCGVRPGFQCVQATYKKGSGRSSAQPYAKPDQVDYYY